MTHRTIGLKTMTDSPIIFFTVSLAENIPILQLSIPEINRLYDNPSFKIICPVAALLQFQTAFDNYINVQIISEAKYLTFDAFKEAVQNQLTSVVTDSDSSARLGWYYQQALKITYLIDSTSKNDLVVMWDADTIPLEKINFFNQQTSQLYGSKIEFHYPYFETLSYIFEPFPKDFYAFTVQFFNCTYNDVNYLKSRLNSYHKKKSIETTGTWISKIIVRSTAEAHGSLANSGFSEQELVGIATMLNNNSLQNPLIYLRGGFNGIMTKKQTSFARLMGFKHITYENIAVYAGKTQSWLALLCFVLKQIIYQRLFFNKKTFKQSVRHKKSSIN
jgi:hypothetical protein